MSLCDKSALALRGLGVFLGLFLVVAVALSVCFSGSAFASDTEELYVHDSAVSLDSVQVSVGGEAASAQNALFAIDSFSRAQTGSDRELDGRYLGYSYYQGSTDDYAVAVAASEYVLVYVPESVKDLCDISDKVTQEALKASVIALDNNAVNGGIIVDDQVPWYFTNQRSVTIEDLAYSFSFEVSEGKYYISVNDSSDVGASANGGESLGDSQAIPTLDASLRPTHVDFFKIVSQEAVLIEQPAEGLAAVGNFLEEVDWSPLWVTLKTTGAAIIFIFTLGLAAAYFSLRVSKRVQSVADTIFTIPMVLPPTVCGFLLLMLLGQNTPVGQWFIDVGFPLVFSWPATVIAAVVVGFPLMYRSARGAFESLDSNMLDAARTLGWSNAKIFFKLMLPLSWSSVAAGTVLAFARALGEFGATLFLAGNYLGVTRTIPIAIYFEWMNGNTSVALFWTFIILVFSFVVILLINVLSNRTTKYRQRKN